MTGVTRVNREVREAYWAITRVNREVREAYRAIYHLGYMSPTYHLGYMPLPPPP